MHSLLGSVLKGATLPLSALLVLSPLVPAVAVARQSSETSGATTPDTAPVLSAEERMAHVSIVRTGQGAPVFLIPGLSSPRAVWDTVLPAIAQGRSVYLVQVNGFAGDDPGDNLNPGVIDGVVSDIAAYIARNRIARPAVIGHSLGGLVAMKLALDHPEAVGRVMVVDTLPFIGTILGADSVAAIEPRAARFRDMALAGADRARAAAAAGPVTRDPGGNMSITAEGRIRVAEWARHADMRVTAQAMYEDMTLDLRPDVSRIVARPFTVLYAAGMGAEQARALWQAAYAGSGAAMVPVADSYHFIMLDQPAAFTAEVTRFLNQ